jgi:hypothetical protein
MPNPADQLSWLLRDAIADARDAGLGDLARLLEETTSTAYTTSSEYFGETGEAIVAFLRNGGASVPPALIVKLKTCLEYVQLVWPTIRA